MMENHKDKLALMAGGHEIWLERSARPGSEIEIGVTYGDSMRADEYIDPETLSPSIIDPDGLRIPSNLTTKNEQHFIAVKAEKPGYYISVVDLRPVIISISRNEGCKLGPKNLYRDIVYAGAYQDSPQIANG